MCVGCMFFAPVLFYLIFYFKNLFRSFLFGLAAHCAKQNCVYHYVGNPLVMLFLQVASRFDVVLVLVPAFVAVLLVDIARFVDVVGNSYLRRRSDGRRRVGLGRLGADRLSRLVYYKHRERSDVT